MSPGSLFPVEGTSFVSRSDPAAAERYRPLPAYAAIGGAQVGQVELDNPACVSTPGAAACQGGLTWSFKSVDGSRTALTPAEYSYETHALATYAPPVRKGSVAWARIDSAAGPFWVKATLAEVITPVSLATYANDFDRWCTSPGKCAPLGPDFQTELAKLREGKLRVVDSCESGYDIVQVVVEGGRPYYEVNLPTLAPADAHTSLPRHGFIPVRTRAGRHTGAFSPRGC